MSLTIEKCLQAWANSLRQMKAKADIVFFGDSLTYYGNFASVFPNKVVCNLGLRGDTIRGMIERIEQVQMLEPKQVFLMAGINDVGKCSLDIFGKQYEELIDTILVKVPYAELVVQNILPVNDRDYTINCSNKQIIDCNELIARIVAQNSIMYLDLYSVYVKEGLLPIKETVDGIHLKSEAYYGWLSLLKQFIIE